MVRLNKIKNNRKEDNVHKYNIRQLIAVMSDTPIKFFLMFSNDR